MSTPSIVTDTHLRQGNHAVAYGANGNAADAGGATDGGVTFYRLAWFRIHACRGWADNGGVAQATAGTGADRRREFTAYNGITVTDDVGMLNATVGRFSAAIDGAVTGTPVAAPGSVVNTAITAGSLAHLVKVSCAVISEHVANGDATILYGANQGELLAGIGWGGSELVAEYPTIDSYGASFATTLFDWGVQGEVVFRPDMPLQIDTDSVVISTLVANCGFAGYGGGTTTTTFTATHLLYASASGLACGDTGLISGIDHQDVWNWDIGTTATFPASNPVTSAIGADRIILLTEFAGVYADGIDDDTGLFESGMPTVNMCTSGSDLPLRSLFNLDPRNADECRATQHAYGMVLYLAAEYPNFLGSAWNYSTNVVYSTGLDGRAVRPAGTWNEDIERASLGMNWEYQGHTKLSLSYSDYFGDEKYDASEDKDFVSFSYSRSF